MTADIHTEPPGQLAAATGRSPPRRDGQARAVRLLAQLREGDAVHRSDAGTWIISGYDLSIAVLRDTRFSRPAATERDVEINFDAGEAAEVYRHKMIEPGGRRPHPAAPHLDAGVLPGRRASLAPVHRTGRRRGVRRRRAAPRGRDRARPSYPIPEHVICTMLGVPAEDHKLFEEWTRVLNARPQAGESDEERRRLATGCARRVRRVPAGR